MLMIPIFVKFNCGAVLYISMFCKCHTVGKVFREKTRNYLTNFIDFGQQE